jgi:hypothetical protein
MWYGGSLLGGIGAHCPKNCSESLSETISKKPKGGFVVFGLPFIDKHIGHIALFYD